MKQKSFVPILVITLIVVLIGVYFIYQKQKLSITPSQKYTKQVTVPGEITNWQTYTNSKYGFKFQYGPESKISKELETDDGRLLVDVSSERFKKDSYLDDVVFFGLEVSKRPCDEWIGDQNILKRTISGIEALTYEGNAAYDKYRRSVCLAKGNDTYFFVQDITYPEHQEGSGTMFYQILSSFEFSR